jgi:hypothetical protein
MFNTQYFKSLTDLRLDPAKIIQLAKQSGNPIYIFNRGKPVSILLDIKVYEDMVERLENALDVVEMKAYKRRNNNRENWISHEQLVKKLVKK